MAKKTPVKTSAAKKASSIKRMSAEHKAALAKGREQGRIVREYLAALGEEKKPGRKLDADTLNRRIDSPWV